VDTQDVQLAKIKSIDTTWKWSYTGQNLVTNVAYDAFTSATPDGPEAYELMVWLGNFNAGPIARLVQSHGSFYFCSIKTDVSTPAHGALTANLFLSRKASRSLA
jgi:xyloglucan-specific endo-beta-1,4-glucanase